MTTEPSTTTVVVSPVTAAHAVSAATTNSVLVRDVTWVRTHVIAILVSIALIVGLILGGVYLVEDLVAKHDASVAAADMAKNNIDTATQAALMNQLTQMQAADAARDAANVALIGSLVKQMTQSRAITVKQVAADNTLDAAAAAQRLIVQTKAAPGEVTVVNNSLLTDLPISRTIIANLDLLAQAQSDVTNLTGQLGAQTVLTTDATASLAVANQVIVADKVELVATVKADLAVCDARVSAQKVADRKHAVWAAIGGFIGGIFLGNRLPAL